MPRLVVLNLPGREQMWQLLKPPMQTRTRCLVVISILVLAPLSGGCTRSVTLETGSGKASPERWSQQDRDRYLALQAGFDFQLRKRLEPEKAAVSSRGMIAGTSEPFAVHAGLEVLKHGGNAADAALTTALAQIALTAGATISYAGIMTVAYYDATSQQVYTLNAGYNTLKEEHEALTIPGLGETSGRTALVPGFMAGVQALHDRFGTLPFAALFAPAIWIAERGVGVSSAVELWLGAAKDVLTRLPATKRIFVKPDGALYGSGELFRQPALAQTLRSVARLGSTYMYTGEWAQHFVDAVRQDGGKMTLEDLRAYRAEWTEPLSMPYRDSMIVPLGAPNTGGLNTLGSLKLFDVANLKRLGHYKGSSEVLYDLIQISRMQSLVSEMPAPMLRKAFPELDWSVSTALSPETAKRLWAIIQQPQWPRAAETRLGTSNHSAGVVVVDERGNVASMVHSCNCELWGTTGIFVDGISVPDSASFQQERIAGVGPGVRLPEGTNPVIVLKDGKPVLASSAIGVALHETTFLNLINVLDFGMDPHKAVQQPNYMGPFLGMGVRQRQKPEWNKETFGFGDFSEAVLAGVSSRGQEIMMNNGQPGYWIGIQIAFSDPRKLVGGVTSKLPAMVEGY